MTKKNIKCPVCGRYTFESEADFDICDICGWENDGAQYRDHNLAGGANDLSVNEARIEYFLLNAPNTRTRAAVLKEEYVGFKINANKELCAAREAGKKPKSVDFAGKRTAYLDKLNKLLNG